MKGIDISWRNPSPVVRIALVAGVFGALGLMGGLYLDLFQGGPLDPGTAAILGGLIGIPLGAWFERDSPLANSDGGAVLDADSTADWRRHDE